MWNGHFKKDMKSYSHNASKKKKWFLTPKIIGSNNNGINVATHRGKKKRKRWNQSKSCGIFLHPSLKTKHGIIFS
jgi:hypothetical protein